MDQAVERWRKESRYLPKFMRDFHDQKDIFKTIHDTIAVEKNEYAKDVGWIAGQCYVIDIFLWFMARHGYVLRRADSALPFDELDDTLAAAKKRRDAISMRALGLTPIKND